MEAIFQVESLNVFQNISEQLMTSLYYSEKIPSKFIDAETFEKAKEEMRSIFSECDFNLQKIKDTFLSKHWQYEYEQYFQILLEKYWPKLLSAALNNLNSNYGETIVNFDWFLKFVLGTSELKTLKYPFLQLLLSTVNKSGQQNNVIYDVNKDKLLKMINILENI